MSTRSGKRIHDSISENVQSVSEKRIERNTRSKRVKEKSDEIETGKKKNFVRRPSNDEVDSSNDKAKNTFKNGRKSRRNTLKELNMLADDYESLINDRKSKRQSRRTRKGDTVEPINLFILESNEFDTREAKNNNKRAVIGSSENRPVKAVTITKKKTNKKKKKSNSFIVEELVTGEHNKSFNKSNVSIDSFHSAAGSPDNSKDNNLNYNSIEHVKNTKKKSKKTESGNQFETAMNEAGKLCALNESFGSSVYKKEDIEDEYGNRFDKEISGTSKIKSKQKKSKKKNVLSDIDNTHKKADVVHSLELNNSIEAGIQSTDLKKNTIGKINSPTSNFDFINNPHVKETLNDLKSVSSLNNSAKKRHNSTCKNSSFDNIDISITSLNECHKDISHNLINKSKVILNEISSNNTTELENLKTSRCKDSTYEKIILSDANLDLTFDKTNNSFDKNCNAVKELSHTNRRSSRRESIIQNTTYDKIDDNFVDMYTTFKVNNKEPSEDYHVETKCIEKPRRSSRISVPQGIVTTVLNDTYDKIIEDSLSYCNKKCEKPKLDTTFERTKDNIDGSIQIIFNKKSSIISSDNTDNMTLDMSEDCSRISIVSDNSKTENIVNTTPLLIDSSMDESQINTGSILLNKTTTPPKKEPITRIITSDKRGSTSDNNKTPLKRETYTETKTTPLKRDGTYTKLRKKPSNSQSIQNEEHKPQGVEDPTTPLKRQGTFTMESPDVMSPKPRSAEKTPTRGKSMPSPGRTPFFSSGSGSKGRTTSNVTHSIEKPQRRSSAAVAHPKQTRVMFRSPVDNPVAVTPMKGKVIKSNLKGSSKSFMFDESASEQCGSRKRSRTQAGPQPGAARNKRARTASAAARLQGPVVAEVTSPVSKSNQKTRTKLPDFAALHRKQFSKMESLDECQRRHARRARALLTPPAPLTPTVTLTPTAPLTATVPLTSTAPLTATEPLTSTAPLTPAASLTPIAPREALHRNNPKETSDTAAFQAAKRPVTQKSIEVDKKNQSYTRFGFKINLDVNPFSVPAKTADVHRKDAIEPRVLKRQATLPSLAGTTLRKEAAKQAVMREKFFTDKRDVNRNQNRTVIKGVRTNRRFELQMKMRNID